MYGTAGVDLGRKAVLGGALQSSVGSHGPFRGPTSSFGRGMALAIPPPPSAGTARAGGCCKLLHLLKLEFLFMWSN